MKRKILFVDDEKNVQQGLRRLLHGMRGVWQTNFADSGRQALALLADSPMDIIVCDLHMPDMNGVDLLKRVKTGYPHMVRIILSGSTDQQSIMGTVNLAHQYLAKPSDPDRLKSTIERACMLKGLLTDEALQRRISGVESLPALPAAYTRIEEALGDPECSVQRVGEIISEDIAMATKLLQLANSAFFSIAREVSSPAEAVVYLGLDIVRALVLTMGIFSGFTRSGIPGRVMESVADHSLRTGTLARSIARSASLGKKQTDDAFIAGLLHDVGKLVLALNEPQTYSTLLRRWIDRGEAIHEDETELLKASHDRVGAYLIGLWGLPHGIVEAVAFHHAPGQCPFIEFDAVGVVHVANALVHDQRQGVDGRNRLDKDYLDRSDVAPQLDEWATLADFEQ